jgi:hypothetical membrane protein
MAMYMGSLPLNAFASDMLQVNYAMSSEEAGTGFGQIYAVSGITLILVGIFVDKFGGSTLI